MKLLFGLALALTLAATAAEIIPFSEIRPGMTGYGLTVVAGMEISRFEVEVVDVLDEPGEMADFIIVRVYGDAIDRSGGIAQGMSGSPIYLDGKLAGALSRAAEWVATPERPLGLVTPIEPMLAVLSEVQMMRKSDEIEVPSGKVIKSAVWGVPVMAIGLSQRALDVLTEGMDFFGDQFFWVRDHPLASLLPPWRGRISGLASMGIPRVVQAPAAKAETLPLVPGAPVGVGLVVGDITIGALGTVTFAEGDSLIAFGHPFLFSGPSEYFLTSAYVFDTVAALDAPFKFGTLGEVYGGVFADRWAAIGGRTDLTPSGIRLDFRIRDLGRPKSKNLSAVMAYEPRLSPLFIFIAGLEATDRTLDRIGPGTVALTYTITGEGLPRPLVRKNVFLSTYDVAIFVPWEASLVADILEYNEFQAPRLTQVSVSAQVDPNFRAMEVLDLVIDRGNYMPGDTIRFTVYTRTWRGNTEAWDGEITIPADLVAPYVELRAYGGPRPLEKGEALPIFESIEDLIDYIEHIPSYDTLTVELFAPDPVSDLVKEPRLYGITALSELMEGMVVYGQASLIIPLFEGAKG